MLLTIKLPKYSHVTVLVPLANQSKYSSKKQALNIVSELLALLRATNWSDHGDCTLWYTDSASAIREVANPLNDNLWTYPSIIENIFKNTQITAERIKAK